jgi:hypothetical protein
MWNRADHLAWFADGEGEASPYTTRGGAFPFGSDHHRQDPAMRDSFATGMAVLRSDLKIGDVSRAVHRLAT